jgi:predicted Asp-tRNA(Asn)/Glu-tRNA(Gln) amidotransferase subunit C
MNPKVDEAKVKQEAKNLLDKFAKALEKVEKEELSESFVDRENFFREEGSGSESDKGFKERMIHNAPRHDEDFVIAEKGNWK